MGIDAEVVCVCVAEAMLVSPQMPRTRVCCRPFPRLTPPLLGLAAVLGLVSVTGCGSQPGADANPDAGGGRAGAAAVLAASGSGGTAVRGGDAENSAAGTSGAAPAGGTGSATAALDVVAVATVTTVQASSGSYLAPEPEQQLPAFIERTRASAEGGDAPGTVVDTALSFRSTQALGSELALSISARVSSEGLWAMEWGFPSLESQPASLLWRLRLQAAAPEPAGALPPPAASEWRAWTSFGGLAVLPATPDSASAVTSAPAALVSFAARRRFAPLELGSEGSEMVITNPSQRTIDRALLIYSHSEGIGVQEVLDLGPGERRVTTLGPKEHPIAELLALARRELTTFFATRVGDELASATAAAKSIPFLETRGLRLIYMLDETEAPLSLEFSSRVERFQQVVVAHAEVLSPIDEANVLTLLASDPQLDLATLSATLGRFTEAKLEFAESQGDAEVSERATALLGELRSRN
jgi:hypothetical protein